MRHRPHQELNSSQRTVWYYPELVAVADPELDRRHRYFELLQSHMLIEDVHTQILPIGGRSRKNSFKIGIVPHSKAVESLVAGSLNSREHGRRYELAASVADFFGECAQYLITFGEAAYEIVFLSNPENNKVVEFKFERVRPLSMRRRGGRFVQSVPEEVVKRRGIPRFIDLLHDRILIFTLPTRLKHSVARTLEALGVLSEKIIPDFALKNFAEAGSRIRYDSANQVYSQKLALAAAGKSIGWNARNLFNDEMLEFYQLKRQLRFEHFKTAMRSSILETLNGGLLLAGRQMGFEAHIEIQGLPTISDIGSAEADLESGNKRFSEILDQFNYY